MLEARDVVKVFRLKGGGELKALDGVSLAVGGGETHALVGESGCGKSTLARLLLKLELPTGGAVTLDGKDLRELDRKEEAAYRRKVQMIFQDPYGSLNPRMKVGDIVGEPLAIHDLSPKAERPERVRELLARVGLNPEAAGRYPRQFSGGQRQRIGIARALAVDPRIIVADEPVSALDVSVQAQVLNLLADIKRERGLSLLFIGHDLRVVRAISDRVSVMYLGKIVESAPVEEFFLNPRHPYSRMLLASVPEPDPCKRSDSVPPSGDPPSPVNRPRGCAFHPRCPLAASICEKESPPEKTVGIAIVSCHLA